MPSKEILNNNRKILLFFEWNFIHFSSKCQQNILIAIRTFSPSIWWESFQNSTLISKLKLSSVSAPIPNMKYTRIYNQKAASDSDCEEKLAINQCSFWLQWQTQEQLLTVFERNGKSTWRSSPRRPWCLRACRRGGRGWSCAGGWSPAAPPWAGRCCRHSAASSRNLQHGHL